MFLCTSSSKKSLNLKRQLCHCRCWLLFIKLTEAMLRISSGFEFSPAVHCSTSVYIPGGCSKQLYRVHSFLLLSWRCRAPSPEWPSLRSSEPESRNWFHIPGPSQAAVQQWFLVLFQGNGVKRRQVAALLCTGFMFTCLHRCMNSVWIFNTHVYNRSAWNKIEKTVEVSLVGVCGG